MSRFKITITVIVFIALGVTTAHNFPKIEAWLKAHLVATDSLYVTIDSDLLHRTQNLDVTPLGWRQLLPKTEQILLEKYQVGGNEDFSQQLSRSIEASKDQDYQQAMYSTNIVEDMAGELVSLSGYIVPIELGEGRTVQRFFLVPYYGACIHYPPPPPNQIVYVSIEDKFPVPDLTMAYTLTGILETGLYEDLIGTSAYQLSLVKVEGFFGQADDLRQH